MNIEIKTPSLNDLCPFCFGSGKQRAMQMAMTHNGHQRGKDTMITCNSCNGNGLKK